MGPLTAPEPHHPDCLHCAWDGVVAALPDGWWLGGVQRHSGRWAASAWGTEPDWEGIHGRADSPQAALTALRAALLGERG